MALFRSTSNRIEHIVPHERWLKSFDAATDANLDLLLRRLAAHANVNLDYLELHHDRSGWRVFDVRCRGRSETIRVLPSKKLFPPSVFIAYLNEKLEASGSEDRLVACRDSVSEVVALCDPDQQAELRQCIFACMDDLRWPKETISDTERDLLQAIAEVPDDDGPRLVYADWLTEQGDRRGEFIMLQCQRDADVNDRARPILEIHQPTWTSHLPPWMFAPQFRRGFVERVWATREMHREHHRQLLQLWPIVPRVEIYDDADV